MRSRLFHEIVRMICEEPPTRPSTAVGLTEERPSMRDSEPVTVTPEMVSRARDASPAELRRQLSGDLDNMLSKSLSKEPLARYRSAGQMSEDGDCRVGHGCGAWHESRGRFGQWGSSI